MQEIITWIVVLIAFSIMGFKAVQSLKAFRKSSADSSCSGCGGGCSGCPVAPENRKIAER